MRGRTKFAIGALAAVTASMVLLGVGTMALRSSGGRGSGGEMVAPASVTSLSGSGAPASTGGTVGKSVVGPTTGTTANPPSADALPSPSSAPMVVAQSSMAMTVSDVGAGVESVRHVVAGLGGTIADLSVSTGSDASGPTPVDASSKDPVARQPSSANLTIRIPAAQLGAAQTKLSALGTIDAQSESQSDVTQQHVDMSARLTNLKAEETRVRGFLARAGSVRELLDIERELTRIRGDIESMQAQVDFLQRQAAMATLTLTLSKPGALVRPAGSGWGFGDAVAQGIQAAVAVVRVLTAGAIALSPLAALAVVVWLAVRLVRRARGRHNGEKIGQTA